LYVRHQHQLTECERRPVDGTGARTYLPLARISRGRYDLASVWIRQERMGQPKHAVTWFGCLAMGSQRVW
jgi:hypothetical protein